MWHLPLLMKHVSSSLHPWLLVYVHVCGVAMQAGAQLFGTGPAGGAWLLCGCAPASQPAAAHGEGPRGKGGGETKEGGDAGELVEKGGCLEMAGWWDRRAGGECHVVLCGLRIVVCVETSQTTK